MEGCHSWLHGRVCDPAAAGKASWAVVASAGAAAIGAAAVGERLAVQQLLPP